MKTSPLLLASLITFGFCSVSQATVLAAWRFNDASLDATTTTYGSGTMEIGAAWSINEADPSNPNLSGDATTMGTALGGSGTLRLDYTVSGLASNESININTSSFIITGFEDSFRLRVTGGGETSGSITPIEEGFYTETFTSLNGLVNGDVVSFSYEFRDGVDADGLTYTFDGLTIQGTVVPEPSSAALLGLGGLALLARRKR